MKTILTAIFAFLLLVTQAQENNFRLICNFPNIEADSVFLNGHGANGLITLASTRYNNGEFTLEGNIEYENFYYLTIKKSNASNREGVTGQIYVEKGSVEYRGEFGRHSQFVVNGGKNTAKIYAYQLSEEYLNLRKEILSYSDNELSDEEKVALQKLQMKMYKYGNTAYTCWPESHPMHQINMARKYFEENDLDLFKKQFAIVIEKYPEHPDTQRLKYMVKIVEEKEKNKGKVTGRIGTDYNNVVLKDKDGDLIDLADVLKENKLTLIDFWASWCSPCRGEFPHLRLAYKEYHSKGFEIYAISLDIKNVAWLKALKKENTPWINVLDAKGFESENVKNYNIKGIPYNVLVDSNGKIVAESLRGEGLEEFLKEHL